MTKFIYGSYPNLQDAETAVRDLQGRGIPTEDISIATNRQHVAETSSLTGVEIVSTEVTEETNDWWDHLLAFFNPEAGVYNPSVTDVHNEVVPVLYQDYRDGIANGSVLVLVEEIHLNPKASDGEPTIL